MGWHESLLFCVDDSGGSKDILCIADQGTSVGLDVSGGGLIIGYYRAFRVPLPDQEAPVVQMIHFSEDKPEKTRIKWREIQ